MKKKILIMGIETSCDETAVSIIQDNGKKPPKILANIISSQEEVHKNMGEWYQNWQREITWRK